MNELVTASLVVCIEVLFGDITLGQLEITSTFCLGREQCTCLRYKTLTQVFQTSTDSQTALRESRLCTAVNDLEEQLAHSSIDSIAYEVGIECLKDSLTYEDLACHSSRVSHTRATDGLHQCLFDDTVLYIQTEFARTLLWSAPTNTVSHTRDVSDLFGFHPLTLFWDWSWTMVRSFSYLAHFLYLFAVNHV